MANSGHGVGVDTQVPDMRGGVCCAFYGCGHFRHNGAVDSGFNAGGLFGVADICCCQVLAWVGGLWRAVRAERFTFN